MLHSSTVPVFLADFERLGPMSINPLSRQLAQERSYLSRAICFYSGTFNLAIISLIYHVGT